MTTSSNRNLDDFFGRERNYYKEGAALQTISFREDKDGIVQVQASALDKVVRMAGFSEVVS